MMQWLKMLPLGVALSYTQIGAAMAAGHVVDIEWNAGGQFTHKAQIQPGKFIEVCGKFTPGQRLAWSFTSSTPVNFNIHYHVGKETVFPAKLAEVKEAAQTLQVQAKQVHCWMWSNKTQAMASLALGLKLEA